LEEKRIKEGEIQVGGNRQRKREHGNGEMQGLKIDRILTLKIPPELLFTSGSTPRPARLQRKLRGSKRL
jgi:hypothetical protein